MIDDIDDLKSKLSKSTLNHSKIVELTILDTGKTAFAIETSADRGVEHWKYLREKSNKNW